MKFSLTTRLVQVLTLLMVLALVFSFSQPINAAILDSRSLELGDSNVSVNTTHIFSFDVQTAGNIGSIEFEYCSNDPFPGQPCTPPSNLNVLAASLDAQSGETGFSIHGSTTANRIVLTRAVAPATPGTVSYEFSNIDNPDTAGSHYVRLGTFASLDGTGARTDEGGIAFSINDGINVGAFVPPILEFCVGVTITGTNCATASGSNVSFGILTPNSTRTGTTQMAAGTNGVGGYTITVIGTTMTSGNNTISANSTPSVAVPGTAQFGLNLVANTSPSVGQNLTGTGTGSVRADYNNVNQFKFANGDILAESFLSTHMNKYTVSYIVNVPDNQKAGTYSTTLTYVCLASF